MEGLGLVGRKKPTPLPSSVVPEVEEFIIHTVCRRYPDGRLFTVKSWTTQKGRVKSKKQKVKTEKIECKKGEVKWM